MIGDVKDAIDEKNGKSRACEQQQWRAYDVQQYGSVNASCDDLLVLRHAHRGLIEAAEQADIGGQHTHLLAFFLGHGADRYAEQALAAVTEFFTRHLLSKAEPARTAEPMK